MKHYLLKVFLFMSVVFVSSCASTKYIVIDIAKPARVSFPANIVNVAVVDNAGLVISDSIVDETYTQEDKLVSVGKEAFKSELVKVMDEQKYFNKVVLYPSFIRTDKNYGQQVPLMKNEVRDIASKLDVDAIVSLDIFSIKTEQRKVNMNSFIFGSNVTTSLLLFRVYDADGNLKAPAIATADSISWLGDNDVDLAYIHQKLSAGMAEGVSQQLIPYWETQERAYYTDGTKEMKEAHKQVAEGNWEQAAELWGKAFDKNKEDKQKAKIAANIALANENLGDINNAVEWIRLASNLISGSSKYSDEYIYINWYKVKLLQRQKDNPLVMDQLGITIEENTETPKE